MKIIVRYLKRKSLAALFFSFNLFTLILLIDEIFQLLNLALARGVSFFLIFRLFLLSLPGIFSLSIPTAALLATLILFGELSTSNELNILRGSGLNHWQIIRTHLLVLLLMMLVALLVNHFWLPETYREFRKQYLQILQNQPLISINPKNITHLENYYIYPAEVDSENHTLKNVVIYKTEPDNLPVRITAQVAKVSAQKNRLFLNLSDGYWLKINHSNPPGLTILKFQNYLLSIPLPVVFGEVSDLRQLSSPELLKKAKNNSQTQKNFFLTEYYLRWCLALAVIFLSFVGLPLATLLEKGSRTITFGLSLGIIFGYYLVMVLAINLSEKNFWPAVMVLFLPNLTMFLGGCYLWRIFLKR